jgi:hypothetical protein
MIVGASLMTTMTFAVLSWLLWSVMGLGVNYFTFLPRVWQTVPLLNMIGLFLLVTLLKGLLVGLNIKLKL